MALSNPTGNVSAAGRLLRPAAGVTNLSSEAYQVVVVHSYRDDRFAVAALLRTAPCAWGGTATHYCAPPPSCLETSMNRHGQCIVL